VLKQVTWLTHALECDLAFRWQHFRDHRALRLLIKEFDKLLYGMAKAVNQAAQLGKMVKVVNPNAVKENRA
jgi:hypothetical protein